MTHPASSMHPSVLTERLQQNMPLIIDGALATELEARGLDLNDALWSARVLMENPDVIRQVHRDYFEAGAQITITASYQATFEGFAQRGISHEQAAKLMQRSVTLAIEARDEYWQSLTNEQRAQQVSPLVAASVGPYGAMLADGSEYRGHYGVSERELMNFHRPRMQVLAASGADLLACETIPCLTEALALAKLMDELSVVGWISFSCKDNQHTCEGDTLAECIQALADFSSVVAVGVNCTAPEYVAPLLNSLSDLSCKLLLAYPNSGESYDATHKCWHGDATPADFLHSAQAWQAAGAQLIGGCCRTTPADIREIANYWKGQPESQ
ncbi:homocysteine S-methyltransferase [Pokkaliibacter sp. CJK22405]|uniref:homocysteine S-methyltransferase n=1 Tax=Pokkaliibacter sp. CJK22405 TaxID=3384615 RepID=UPI003984DCCF